MKKILEKIFPNIVKMKIEEVLKKCFENKILVHFEYEKSYSEKFGIIEKFDNKKITLKEIDKMMGNFCFQIGNIGWRCFIFVCEKF